MKTNYEKIILQIIRIIGVVLTLYGLILCVMSNLNLGFFLVAAIGIFLLCLGCYYPVLKKFSGTTLFKVCRFIFIIILCAEVVLVSFIAIYGLCDNADYTEDAVIVLGAGIRGDRVTLPLKMRLDKAIEYHAKNPDAVIVVTGGQGFQETVTEGYAMEKYLVQNGVDKSKIIKEEKATSTAENMRFSKEILDKHFAQNYSVVVVTNNFHVFRGVSIAEAEGFKDVSHIHASLQWYNILPCFLRESLAVIKMFVSGR